MRPRAGTLPVTLEPRLVVEVLSLARQHDEMLKEARQDLFRAETKLNVERRWKWPVRLGIHPTEKPDPETDDDKREECSDRHELPKYSDRQHRGDQCTDYTSHNRRYIRGLKLRVDLAEYWRK